MLREILSVSGRPGLFKLLSQGKNSLIVESLTVESLTDKRRTPVHATDRVVSLAEIAIYTTEGETPLGEVLDLVYTAAEGKEVDLKTIGATKESTFAYMESVLPTYDKDRVYPTDVKKMLSWYNILVRGGFTRFTEEETPAEGKEEEVK